MDSTSRLDTRSTSAFISRLLHKDSSLGYILLGPAFIFLAVMMAYPFVYAVYLSFTDKQIGAPADVQPSTVNCRNTTAICAEL